MRIRSIALALLVGVLFCCLPVASAQNFITDSLTGTAGSDLAAHSPSVGGTWAQSTGSHGTIVFDSAGTAVIGSSSGNDDFYYNGATPSSANYTVQATITPLGTLTGADTAGVQLRCVGTANTNYEFVYYEGSGGWAIFKHVGGSGSAISGTTSATLTTGTPYVLKFVANGTTLTGYVKGVQVATCTDSTITAAGYAGIELNNNTGGSSTTDFCVSNFSAFTNSTPSFTVSPTTATTGSNETITVTGSSTSWISGTTFSVSGGTGASISSTSVNAGAQTATFTLTPGSIAGTLTISDSTDSATATITASAPSVATGYSLAGPSSGTVGSPSTNFTVTLTPSGGTASSTVITPASTLSGSFSPTTVTLSTGTPSVTFTFTASAGGTATISTTNSGSLTNPTSLSYSASAGYVATNSYIHYSPYQWHVSSASTTEMETNCSTASFTLNISGTTSVVLNFDTSAPVNAGAALWYRIDLKPFTVTTVSSSITVTLPDTGAHTITVLTPWLTQYEDRWVTPSSVVRLASITTAGTLAAVTGIPSQKMLVYSDSRGEGCVINDGYDAWPHVLGTGMGYEVGVRSFASDGFYQVNGSGSQTGYIVPLFTVGNDTNSMWDKYDSTHSLLTAGEFSPIPTMIVVMLGVNDVGVSNTNEENSISGFLAACRTAAPGAKIVVLQDFSGAQRTAISGGFSAYTAAHSGDTLAYLGDGGTNAGLAMVGYATYISGDGTHPNLAGHAIEAATQAEAIQSALGGATAAGTIYVYNNSGRGRTLK
jgi:hypothetical protein